MIKHITFKAMITFAALLIAFVTIGFVTAQNRATSDGFIHLIIEDADGAVLFDDEIVFHDGESFYDILNRTFTLTCANAHYQPDETCSHGFVLGPSTNGRVPDKVILGIKGQHFDLMTNWTDQFLAFEVYVNQAYVLTTQGPSNLAFENGQSFRIKVKTPNQNWGNGA